MALNMIEQSIKDGWRIKNTDDVKKLIDQLFEKRKRQASFGRRAGDDGNGSGVCHLQTQPGSLLFA